MQAAEDIELTRWLQRMVNFTSHQCCEEIQTLMAHEVLRNISSDIRKQTEFGIICDGSQDICGKDQECICIRYVDENLCIHEEFVGFYEQGSTTGEAIAITIKDVLQRLMLPMENLRAQTYDGAANMQGVFKGCQSILVQEQPLALPFHCSAHCINLVMVNAVDADPLPRDAIQNAHELGKLYKRSGKFQTQFKEIASEQGLSPHSSMIRPLCPTRWLCRGKAIAAVLGQYETVLESLYTMSIGGNSDVANKARGLHACFLHASTLLALKMVYEIIALLEELNKMLQSSTGILSSALEGVAVVKTTLLMKRSDAHFEKLFNEVTTTADLLSLNPLELPRRRVPPSRYTDGTVPAYVPISALHHFKVIFYKLIDTAVQQLDDRFNVSSALGTYLRLEQMLIEGEVDAELLVIYQNDIDPRRLETQLQMYHNEYHKPATLLEVKKTLMAMSRDARR